MTAFFSYRNIRQADFPIDRQFHVLKHFDEIDPHYRQYLIRNSEYSDEDIDRQIKEKGSRFFKSFASDPLHLLDMVVKKFRNDGVNAKWSGDRCEVPLSFSKKAY